MSLRHPQKLFRTYAAVQKHQRRQHEVRIRPKCEICQREFPTASLLREHVAVIHLNLRPFKCTKCSAVFGRQGCLRRHDMMCHLNYVYICFGSAYSLYSHSRTTVCLFPYSVSKLAICKFELTFLLAN
ncbi:unnamed protein product [Brugia pahangi]|uniref:C2H2-type domain-containing protein n=1 Tax=Brugia pahangi TaxID=6280 RepID=A0A0N4TFT1_BRUPA|nr:unnamed protein product [Brugia pahangi]